jgi:hypothetical protein
VERFGSGQLGNKCVNVTARGDCVWSGLRVGNWEINVLM